MSEEENKSLQEEELSVLESIYGDTCSVSVTENGQIFEIRIESPLGSIPFCTPNPNSVHPHFRNPNSQHFDSQILDNENLSSQNPNFLNFRVHLPKNYPLENSPVVELNSDWISVSIRQKIWAGLEEIALNGIGEVVIFKWIDWIREQSWIWDSGKGQNEVISLESDEPKLVDEDREMEREEEEREVEGENDDGFYEKGTKWGFMKKNGGEETIYDEKLNASIVNVKGPRGTKGVQGESMEDVGAKLGVIHGTPFTEKRSTFQAHLSHVENIEDVEKVMEFLISDRKISGATHNIMAYRIVIVDSKKNDVQNLENVAQNSRKDSQNSKKDSENSKLSSTNVIQDFDDDGENAAGSRLLHLLQVLNAQNVIVVVSRWFGGILLGPDRFKHINNAARDLLEACGYISQNGKSKGKKK